LLDVLVPELGADVLALHCHDTYGQALANIACGLQYGIATIDASVAGLGGCPYAPGSNGNVATEDVVYMLQDMGINCGVDLQQLIDIGQRMSAKLGRPSRSKVALAQSH
jgi:hydroxymethylglutaryl-CoA lyase